MQLGAKYKRRLTELLVRLQVTASAGTGGTGVHRHVRSRQTVIIAILAVIDGISKRHQRRDQEEAYYYRMICEGGEKSDEAETKNNTIEEGEDGAETCFGWKGKSSRTSRTGERANGRRKEQS